VFHKKIETLCEDFIKTPLQDQSDTRHAVSQLGFFFKKKQGVSCGCYLAIFAAKNRKEDLFRENSVCRFHT